MNSTFINRFPAVALWFWLAGVTMGAGLGSQNGYLIFFALAVAALGAWLVVAWEVERQEKEDLGRRIVAQIEEADETLDLDRRIALSGIKRIVESGGG